MKNKLNLDFFLLNASFYPYVIMYLSTILLKFLLKVHLIWKYIFSQNQVSNLIMQNVKKYYLPGLKAYILQKPNHNKYNMQYTTKQI